jgi:hypothetical protein
MQQLSKMNRRSKEAPAVNEYTILQARSSLPARHARMKAKPMALSFPNRSRYYDATRDAIRFWGYDNAMETSFPHFFDRVPTAGEQRDPNQTGQ